MQSALIVLASPSRMTTSFNSMPCTSRGQSKHERTSSCCICRYAHVGILHGGICCLQPIRCQRTESVIASDPKTAGTSTCIQLYYVTFAMRFGLVGICLTRFIDSLPLPLFFSWRLRGGVVCTDSSLGERCSKMQQHKAGLLTDRGRATRILINVGNNLSAPSLFSRFSCHF